jgi:hypothetical protein
MAAEEKRKTTTPEDALRALVMSHPLQHDPHVVRALETVGIPPQSAIKMTASHCLAVMREHGLAPPTPPPPPSGAASATAAAPANERSRGHVPYDTSATRYADTIEGGARDERGERIESDVRMMWSEMGDIRLRRERRRVDARSNAGLSDDTVAALKRDNVDDDARLDALRREFPRRVEIYADHVDASIREQHRLDREWRAGHNLQTLWVALDRRRLAVLAEFRALSRSL